MKRWLVRICVFLFFGAIVNVAVAWGCAAYGPSLDQTVLFDGTPRSVDRMHPRWLLRTPEGWPSTPQITVVVTRVGAKGYWGIGPENERFRWRFQGVRMYGWPRFSMHVRREAEATEWWRLEHQLWIPAQLSDGILLPDRLSSPKRGERVLPTLPLLPGFAINTVFYAAVLWLLFAGPFVVRRWRRMRSGLCPKCAYDLRGNSGVVCPECGASR